MARPTGDALGLFDGEGEVRALCRDTDWSATPLGPVSRWPAELRAHVRTCLDSAFPISLWCGPELVLIYNDAYRQVLGDKHPAALGRPGPEVWEEVWSAIAPALEQIRGGGAPVYAEDAPFMVRRSRPSPGASPHQQNAWFTYAFSPVRDPAGEVVAVLNIATETTRRVLAERQREAALADAERAHRRLLEVFMHAPAFLAVLRGEDHVFEYVNDAYLQLVGHRQLLGMEVLEALPEMRGQGFRELLDDVLRTGEPYVGREVPVTVTRRSDAEPEQRFVDVVYYPITEAGGARSGVVAHGSDVTAHVLARREAQRARADAERANQAKSQFLANMSHEIRTPINAVMGYTDLLAAGIAGPLGEQHQEYVGRIRASSQHLLGLVNDVLDLAKIEAGEMSVDTMEASVGYVFANAAQMVAPQAEARGITLEVEPRPSEDVHFIGDPDRVLQVVLNLLSNALKFTPADGRVVLRCRVSDTGAAEAALPEVGPWVVIEVEDTGIGIEPEQIARIFEPFVQADGGHTRRAGGTGLGLSISRRFCRLMDGDLTVRSRPGEGSCFSVWLPSPQQQGLVPSSAWLRAAEWPRLPGDVPGLTAVGQILLGNAERVEEALVARLRGDAEVPDARPQERGQLADHTASYVAALGAMMVALAGGGGESALVKDGEDIQALLAQRHGSQRHRLGWTREELLREYQILHGLLHTFVKRASVEASPADVQSALGVLHRLVDRAQELSLAAFLASDG